MTTTLYLGIASCGAAFIALAARDDWHLFACGCVMWIVGAWGLWSAYQRRKEAKL